MSATPLHLMHFEGGNALSALRAQALLARLQSVCARVSGVVARHVHWAAFDAAPARAAVDKLQALQTYGDAFIGPASGECVVVMPRLGTVSPWASKATDIARNCGLVLHRLERVTEYTLSLKGGAFGLLGAGKPLQADERLAVADVLHDRMTEHVAFERQAAGHLFDVRDGAPLVHVDVLSLGAAALVRANAEFGLALSADEIDYRSESVV